MGRKDDYSIQLENVTYLAPEDYAGTTILFVIQGELVVSLSEHDLSLGEDDLVVLNHNEAYTARGAKDTIVIRLHITSPFFTSYYADYFQLAFDCVSSRIDPGREKMMTLLRKYLAEMMIAQSHKAESSKLEMQSALFQIMLLLTRFFKKELPAQDGVSVHDTRITRITQQLEQQFDEPITLQDIAEQEFLSTSYLSRYFKKVTGLGFLQYLTQIRLKHSLEDLRTSSANISQIAQKNGFSSPKNFTTSFKAHYGKTPATYRQEALAGGVAVAEKSEVLTTQTKRVAQSPSILARLVSYRQAAEQVHFVDEAPFEKKTISIASSKPTAIPDAMHILTIGELREVLKENVQTQLVMAKDELSVRYVGIRHLIQGSTLLPDKETDEKLPTSSPYANADLAIGYLKKLDLGLFIRMEYQEIAVDEEAFFEKLEHFLRHMMHVFGRQFVSRWYFMYFEKHLTVIPKKELQRVYVRLRAVLKRFDVRIQVGSYLPFSERREAPLSNHEWMAETANQIDFIAFNANQNEAVDFSKSAHEEFMVTRDYVLSKTRKLKQYLRSHHLDKPLILINWNTLTGNTRYTNGTFFRGALIFQTVLAVSSEVAGLGFWINTELHEDEWKERNIRLDGLELFHFFNGKRPAFYALKFKERLCGELVACGNDFVLTEFEDGYQLVLLNCTHFNPLYSVEDSLLQDYRKESHIRLKGLLPGHYQLRMFQFDRDNGALYSMYWELNSRHGLDQEVLDYAAQASVPKLSVSDEVMTDDWSFYAYLDVNAIHFYEFRRTI
ncbi:AraC family transcriptional regulator [Listeria newyorkensis]|uniref:AraC family transcriptional regulator n=1 Tax=Listeria newyorkensis TaxID=1497681 RepID=A0ABX4XK85_9LIST|nr:MULTISPECIES: helix-turn-helix domain-containing protein [Listeria]KGL45932.1 AraC family transcriptional regulator [Listeriaceae bacterium FSL A5-0209]KGL43211.1 AraC family transcriptional regulator [Listeria newyorkensis]PNP90915.1 AraC family transcriptional regulator [Listeria newyorkensis]RQW65518.1 helix-turn-helix domain-containing protein [Listeria sp. SHR_NRA_18]WAO20392.1 helix-turn-helix domain-containing protein [Listeria newyorkensis]